MRTINFSQTNNDLRESDSEENKKLIVQDLKFKLLK